MKTFFFEGGWVERVGSIMLVVILFYGLYTWLGTHTAPRYSPTRITWTEEDEARADRAAEERERGHVRSELRRIREELETLKSEQERHPLRRLRSF